MLPPRVTVLDVAARDGLQNEPQPVATADKLALVQRLQAAGLRELEVASFVDPRRVPQMADGAAVMAGLPPRPRAPGVRYSVLVPNLQGLRAALCDDRARWPDEIVVFGAASERFSQRNIGCGIDASIERFAPVVAAAREAGVGVRGSISCAVGCPFEGSVAPAQVGRVAERLQRIGVQHVSVADTIGVGTPLAVQAALEAVLAHFPLAAVSGHFHDTYGQALANVFAALQLGVHRFDASVAGLGGCPFAPGATGNLATEDLVFLLHGLGIETGIDLATLAGAGAFVSDVLGRPGQSRAGRALLAQRARAAA